MNLAAIHAATVGSRLTTRDYADAALDCILLANESDDPVHDSALTQAMVYAQLASAAAAERLANTFQDASGAAYVGVRAV